jgi:osmotically-inducible protein OsmY
MRPRTWPYGDPEGEALPIRDRPYESFGQQGFAMPDHVADPYDVRRGAATIDLGRRPAPVSPRGVHRRDERIYDDVCRALTVDGHVDATDIEVVVRDGEVHLSGRVPDRRQRRRAEAIAEHVRGVFDVMNRLVVGDR